MSTKERILETGMRLWCENPEHVTARRIARELNMVHGSIAYHFPNGQKELRDAIAEFAVRQNESRVITYLIAVNHKAVQHLDDIARLYFIRQAR